MNKDKIGTTLRDEKERRSGCSETAQLLETLMSLARLFLKMTALRYSASRGRFYSMLEPSCRKMGVRQDANLNAT